MFVRMENFVYLCKEFGLRDVERRRGGRNNNLYYRKKAILYKEGKRYYIRGQTNTI